MSFQKYCLKNISDEICKYEFRRHHRRSFNLYLLFLALSDAFVSAAYILLMSMNVLSDYTKWPSLVSIWYGIRSLLVKRF